MLVVDTRAFMTRGAEFAARSPRLEAGFTLEDADYGRNLLKAAYAAGAVSPRDLAGCDSVAIINYTGGTTGKSKGALRRHRELSYFATTILAGFEIQGQYLAVGPISHVTGTKVLLVLTKGGTVHMLSRMIPGDKESWHREWMRVADRNESRGRNEEGAGHIRTAMNCYLRAADYYRQAEFHLKPDDPRRLPTFTKMEACSHRFLGLLNPPGQALQIPYEGKTLYAYFVRAPYPGDRLPCLICMGGLDSIKDEMWFMQAHGALQRGISVLMIDGPGQGGTLRRHGIANRFDYEVPIGRCIDYLSTRSDVDMGRIAVCGSSLGGYYAARAGCYEHRLAACISHGAIWSVTDLWGNATEEHGLAEHIKWVFGAGSMKQAMAKARDFTLEGHLEHMRCPYLVLHGGHDVLTVSQARKVYDYGKVKGVDVTLRLVAEGETGAEHCQHDNPTIGQELMADWLADRFGINQPATLRSSINPLL